MTVTVTDRLPAEPCDIVAALGSLRAQALAVELRRALLVLAWADAHPGDHLDESGARTLSWQHAEQAVPRRDLDAPLGGERALQPAGIGTPLVAEFSLSELAAVLEVSTAAARRLVGDLLELRHRLRRCWRRFEDLEVPLWRVRRVAQATVGLTPHAAAAVDREVSSAVHVVGVAVIERTVAAARWRHDPDDARELARLARESLGVTVRFGDGTSCLSADVQATLDHDDAVDLERAVAAGAEALAGGGSVESLAVRRSRALGILARGEVTLTFEGAGREGTTTTRLPRASREVVLHVHVSESAVTGSVFDPGRAGGAAQVEQGPVRVAPVEAVRAWCGAGATTRITVRPVLDPSDDLVSSGYVPGAGVAEQVVVRDGGCVFPGCTRPARSSDLDHVVPHGLGGPTSSGNLAPLCRYHHRLKTHGGWRYRRLPGGGPGAQYEWTSPHRQRFLVTTCVGRAPQTRRLAGLPGGRAGPASIRPQPAPGRRSRETGDDPSRPEDPSPDDVPAHTPSRDQEPAPF